MINVFEFPMPRYKCPNGLPPEECQHIPQLLINMASFLQKKLSTDDRVIKGPQKSSSQQKNNAKTRMRG